MVFILIDYFLYIAPSAIRIKNTILTIMYTSSTEEERCCKSRVFILYIQSECIGHLASNYGFRPAQNRSASFASALYKIMFISKALQYLRHIPNILCPANRSF